MSAAEVELASLEKNALGIEYSLASSIGERLKEARENASIAKEYVAKKAKIRERYIDAIEIGDWDILPPGLNGRGLVRLYAKEIGVSLPEFDEFNNLQTIQAEKQSEHLSQNNFIKKSRYQPAAEESAEVIKIVPRSEYKSAPHDDQFSNNYINTRESNIPHNYSKPLQTRTHHTASIVTPKILDVIGLELSSFDSNKFSADHETENKATPNKERNNLHILPLAKPVSKPTKIEANQKGSQQTEAENKHPSIYLTPESQKILNRQEHITEQNSSKKVNYIKIILCTLFPILIIGIGYNLFWNSPSNHKVDSEPLLSSERQLINSNEKKTDFAQTTLGQQQSIPSLNSLPQVPIILERSAKVDILARVKLQIEADGKEIFSGYRQPGPLEFNFKDKAEILVYDASKVKLTYGAWDHGELGWNERKRKITLNAKPYEEE